MGYIETKVGGYDILSTLLSSDIIDRDTHTIILRAFYQGGFIAGGFVRRLLFSMFQSKPEDLRHDIITKRARDLKNYLGTYNEVADLSVLSGQGKNGKNDIDIFFPTLDARNAFFRAMKGHGKEIVSASSPGGAAVNFLINKKYIVQAITRHVAPIKEMLKTFDIVNGMCALSSTHITIDDRIPTLETNLFLGVDRWDHYNVFKRILSWQTKHQLTGIDPIHNVAFALRAHQLLGELISGSIWAPNGTYEYTLAQFEMLLGSFAKLVSPDSLILLSTLNGIESDKYQNSNWAFGELVSRSSDEVIRQMVK